MNENREQCSPGSEHVRSEEGISSLNSRKLSRSVIVRTHPSKPMVNERRLPDTGPGNYGDDIHLLPRIIQESDIFLPSKNIASCDGQPGN
jgi:hypothetical protein